MSLKQIPNELFFEEIEQALKAGRKVTIPMRGVSMLPMLREGRDAVCLSAVEPEMLRKGDVVLFRYGGRHILHRIKSKKGNEFHMQGDGLLGNGERCTEDDVIAKVEHVVRRHGKDSASGTSSDNDGTSRHISTSSFSWRLRSALWLTLRPLLLRLRHFLSRLSFSRTSQHS